jgi:hypothetical protein
MSPCGLAFSGTAALYPLPARPGRRWRAAAPTRAMEAYRRRRARRSAARHSICVEGRRPWVRTTCRIRFITPNELDHRRQKYVGVYPRNGPPLIDAAARTLIPCLSFPAGVAAGNIRHSHNGASAAQENGRG